MRARGTENLLESCIGFDWDDWNTSKNCEKHRVTPEEAESVFFHDPLLVRHDTGLSIREILANQRDVPYQSLMKVFLAERVEQERRPARKRA